MFRCVFSWWLPGLVILWWCCSTPELVIYSFLYIWDCFPNYLRPPHLKSPQKEKTWNLGAQKSLQWPGLLLYSSLFISTCKFRTSEISQLILFRPTYSYLLPSYLLACLPTLPLPAYTCTCTPATGTLQTTPPPIPYPRHSSKVVTAFTSFLWVRIPRSCRFLKMWDHVHGLCKLSSHSR